MIRKLIGGFIAAASLLVSVAQASEKGTRDDAIKMVSAALAHVKAVGVEKAFADFTAKGGRWHDRDLYVFCWDDTGTARCHGANEKLIGKTLVDLKDPDGKLFIREFVEVAKSAKGQGWVEYKWTNPVSKSVEQKESWIVRVPNTDLLLGVGIYKR